MPSIEIRPAVPEDVSAAVPLIYSSGPAAFDWLFPPTKQGTARDFLAHGFVQGQSLFGYQCHLVAVRDGQVVGTLARNTQAETARLHRAVASEAFHFYGPLRLPGLLWRGRLIDRALPPPLPERLYLGHIGVPEELRGHGIGSILMKQALEEARAANLVASLDVAVTNPRAQALYERVGFRVVTERPGISPNVPGHRYMELAAT